MRHALGSVYPERLEEHEDLRECPADETAAREGEQPGRDHALGDVPLNAFGIL